MAHAWNNPAMGIQVGIDTGGVEGEIGEAFAHGLESRAGCQGCHHPQAVAFNPAGLELLEGMDQPLAGGDLGGKDQHPAAVIHGLGQPIDAVAQVGNLG